MVIQGYFWTSRNSESKIEESLLEMLFEGPLNQYFLKTTIKWSIFILQLYDMSKKHKNMSLHPYAMLFFKNI